MHRQNTLKLELELKTGQQINLGKKRGFYEILLKNFPISLFTTPK